MKQIFTALICAAAVFFAGCSHSGVSGEIQKEEQRGQKEQDTRWIRFELTNEDGTAFAEWHTQKNQDTAKKHPTAISAQAMT